MKFMESANTKQLKHVHKLVQSVKVRRCIFSVLVCLTLCEYLLCYNVVVSWRGCGNYKNSKPVAGLWARIWAQDISSITQCRSVNCSTTSSSFLKLSLTTWGSFVHYLYFILICLNLKNSVSIFYILDHAIMHEACHGCGELSISQLSRHAFSLKVWTRLKLKWVTASKRAWKWVKTVLMLPFGY
jgi:hypothetical protein